MGCDLFRLFVCVLALKTLAANSFDSELNGSQNFDRLSFFENLRKSEPLKYIRKYPYHVGYGSSCGGTIISDKWILTAASCVKSQQIYSGSDMLYIGQYNEIKSYHVHPNWTTKNKKEHPKDYDFQLLELKNTLQFDNNTAPVKLARTEDIQVGKMLNATGWGTSRKSLLGFPLSMSPLRGVQIPIVSKSLCQHVNFDDYKGKITDRMICVGYPDEILDACWADYGGPAVSDGRVVGVMSIGSSCAVPGIPEVYANVAAVRKWIEETTGLNLD